MKHRSLGLAAAVALMVVVLPGCGDYRKEFCEPLRADARDAKKVKYVRDWVVGHRDDPRIREPLGKFSSVLLDDRTIRDLGGFDWKLLGFDEGNGAIEIYGADANSDQIDAVAVYVLRSYILISMDSGEDMKRTQGPVDLAGLERFPDGVFVFCGSAHGEYPD